MIKAALFDVFGTVVDWRRGVATAVAPALSAKAIRLAPADFADAWRAQYQPSMERIRAGGRRYAPLDHLHLENLDHVLSQHGLSGRFDVNERADLNRAWEQLPPWPDAVPGLWAIRRSCLIAPCSNGSVALMARLARFAGLPWDAILGADIAQTYKPSPEAYRASVGALGLEPAEVAMVAAHNSDLAAARAQGLATAFVPRPLEHGPDQSADLDAEDAWDFVATDFLDLAQQLTRQA